MGAQRPGRELAKFEQAARRERGKRLQLNRRAVAFYGEKHFAVRRDGPEIRWLTRQAKFVARMILRETAILVSVRSAPRARAQVHDQFIQFDGAASCFHPDKNSAGRRSHQQIEVVRRGAMFFAARFQAHVPL